MNRNSPWVSYWLKRYAEEGIEGLEDKLKSGRHPELPPEVEYEIREILKQSNQGWTTKQIEELITMIPW